MRALLIALLFLACPALADRADDDLTRARIAYDKAQAVLDSSARVVGPAERHRLLGIAARWSQSALESARRAQQLDKARAHAMFERAQRQRAAIDVGRKKFKASTDIVVQRVLPYRPNVTIVRQAKTLRRNQTARKRALSTRANLVREADRKRLNEWRRARIAKRVANGRR